MLGKADVEGMLQSISVNQWRTWLMYMRLNPIGSDKDEVRWARLYQILININRNSDEHPRPFPIEDFYLGYSDILEPPKPKLIKKQTVEEMERNLTDWVVGANQVYEERRRQGLV